jgi:hypothetical protein
MPLVLDQEAIRQIMLRIERGENKAQIARDYGVTEDRIRQICWENVT